MSPFIDPVTKKKIDFVDRPKAAAATKPAKASWFSASAPAAAPPADASVVVDGGEGLAGSGSMEAHFMLEHVEECMGGGFKGELFDLDKYRARMMVGRGRTGGGAGRAPLVWGDAPGGTCG